MPCNLRFAAKDFDVVASVEMLSIEPFSIWKQGETTGRGNARKPFPKSGFSLSLSDAGFDSFEQQVAEVITFIKAHKRDFNLIRDLGGCLQEVELWLDFGLDTRMFTVGVQIDYVPVELIGLCAEMGAGIKLSQYSSHRLEEEDGDESPA